jgi:hypothetical protein
MLSVALVAFIVPMGFDGYRQRSRFLARVGETVIGPDGPGTIRAFAIFHGDFHPELLGLIVSLAENALWLLLLGRVNVHHEYGFIWKLTRAGIMFVGFGIDINIVEISHVLVFLTSILLSGSGGSFTGIFDPKLSAHENPGAARSLAAAATTSL